MNTDYKNRLDIRNEMKLKGSSFHYPSFKKNSSAEDIHKKYSTLKNAEKTEDLVSVAGRIIAIRNSGLFLDVSDASGKIQLFCHNDILDVDSKELLEKVNIGDIIGVKGKIRRTPRGELTIDAIHLTLLAKALLPLPEKYHGLSDKELRYRQRYVDLISNESARDVLRKRFQIISLIRMCLAEKGFMEVEAPMLHSIPGGALARPFVTHHSTLDLNLYLRIAPELYLKRLIIGGLSEKVFELNRCFRNEGISIRHNPEFTSVEIYQAYSDYSDMIDIFEDLIKKIVSQILDDSKLRYGELELDIKTPWPRKTMSELVQEKTGIDFLSLKTDLDAQKIASELGVNVLQQDGWGKCLEKVFVDKVEESLLQPIHVTEFPKEISPLAKAHPSDERLTERFESYINGWEIANGFSELNDPIDQRERFLSQMKLKEQGDKEAHDLDTDFLTALEYGMPPTGGLGIGIDRLVMILTNSSSIREVIAFPTLRKKEKND